MDLEGAGIEEARRANQSRWIWPVTMPLVHNWQLSRQHLDHPCAKKRNKDLSIFSVLSKQHLLSRSCLIIEDRTAKAFCPLSQKALKILTLRGQRVNDGLFLQSAWSQFQYIRWLKRDCLIISAHWNKNTVLSVLRKLLRRSQSSYWGGDIWPATSCSILQISPVLSVITLSLLRVRSL